MRRLILFAALTLVVTAPAHADEHADSDDAAHPFRDDAAHYSEMIPAS